VSLATTIALSNASYEWRTYALCRDTSPELFFPVGTTGPALAQISEALAALATNESAPDRARFLAGYARELGKETQTQLDQSNKSAVAAKGLLNEIKGSLAGIKD
jgi:hypothetical protein